MQEQRAQEDPQAASARHALRAGPQDAVMTEMEIIARELM